jgi:hypothetical protein
MIFKVSFICLKSISYLVNYLLSVALPVLVLGAELFRRAVSVFARQLVIVSPRVQPLQAAG